MNHKYREPNTKHTTWANEGLISFVPRHTLMFGRDNSSV